MKQRKESDRFTLQWLGSVSGKKKIYIILLVIVQMALSLGSISYALIFRGIVDAAVGGIRGNLKRWILLFIVVVIFQVSMGACNRFLREYTQASLENCFKNRLLSFMFVCDYEKISRRHSGEWMNRLTSDTVVIAEGMTQMLPGITGMLIRLIGALILLIVMYPMFGYLIVPSGLLLIGVNAIFRKILKKLHKQVQEADGDLRIFLQESLTGMLVIRVFGKEKQTIEKADEKMAEHKAARMRRNHISNLCNSGFNGAMNAAYVVGTAVGGYGILTGTITYGTLLAMIQLIGQLQSPFANLTGFFPQYYAMLASAERIREVEEYPLDQTYKDKKTAEQIQEFYRNDLKSLVLKDAGFSYISSNSDQEDVRPVVLEHINLEIQKGMYIALTGPSGCGKSTLLKVLMCLYQLNHGIYQMKTETGIELMRPEWRGLFAYVPQGNALMSGTIREVMTFGICTENGEEQIWQALQIAEARDFVMELPKGLDTFLGERGTGLSEGQMQRIAIARAIYANRPILVLDESTSALDEEMEKKVLSNLREMTEKTVLIVTHRKAALKICDMELRFSEGRIREISLKLL